MWQKIKAFIVQNSQKLFAIALTYFVMDLLSTLPYLNVAFTTRNKLFIAIFLSSIVFRFRTKAFLFIAIFSILLSMIALFVSRQDIAENLGNLLFLLLWVIFIINFPVFLRNLKKKQMLSKFSIVKELFGFLGKKGLWWLIPVIFVFIFIGLFILVAGSSPLAPIIYPLF